LRHAQAQAIQHRQAVVGFVQVFYFDRVHIRLRVSRLQLAS